MTVRANASSGPKAHLEPTGSHNESAVLSSIVWGIAVGLLLVVVGYLLDTHDTYFSALLPASFASGAIVGFFVWRRERQTSFVQPHGPFESGNRHIDKHVEHLVPFGPGGVGQWTGHPIGLVIVIGLVLMCLVSRTPLSVLALLSLLGGAVVGICLWLCHR